MRTPCCVVLFAMLAGHPVPFERGGRWGYKDAAGRVVIQPRFEVAGEFSAQGLAAVVDEGGWAYIDAGGRLVIRPLIVDNGPDYFEEGLARFRRGGAVGFFARNGQVVIEAKFAFALPFSEGLAAVCQRCKKIREGEHAVVMGGEWGFIDGRGNLVIPFGFEQAGRFDHGRARVKSAGEWKSIDKKGRVVAEASIGSAWMEADGTIVLQLRAEGPGPAVGDALLRYPKTHPRYNSVLRHLGGLKAGERKPVPPWPGK
ncbi:MAG: WG repeat-containing protein [Bryobacterales bacterium]|nr:WG repeat-containing protein [Bryobacterales bacterium]